MLEAEILVMKPLWGGGGKLKVDRRGSPIRKRAGSKRNTAKVHLHVCGNRMARGIGAMQPFSEKRG